MIAPTLRTLLFVLAAGYCAMGVTLFLAPHWAANNFAWRVSPFVAMTIGGWCIGTAWVCFIVAQRAQWWAMICPILYLALFGIFESAVVISFRERLLISHPLAWLYCGILVGTCLVALAALFEARRHRPIVSAVGPPLSKVAIGLALLFIGIVGFLGIYGLTAVPGMRGLNASIFPEQLSPFSLRAFGAFYFALALAVVPLLWARGIGNLVNHGFAMYALLVFITLAAIFFIERFDFVGRPTQLFYIGIYLAVATAVGVYLVRYGTGARMMKAGADPAVLRN
jgi:hypothetical protein